jgi:hypothetical protein
MFIPDLGSKCFPSRIPDPGSKRFRIPDPAAHLRIYVLLTPKIVFKLSEMRSGNVHSGSRIQGSKRHRIPDPQHWMSERWMARRAKKDGEKMNDKDGNKRGDVTDVDRKKNNDKNGENRNEM